jgi:hypothetical protein
VQSATRASADALAQVRAQNELWCFGPCPVRLRRQMSNGGADVSVRAYLLRVQQKASIRVNEALAQEKEALLREKHKLLLDAAMHKQVRGPLRYLASWVSSQVSTQCEKSTCDSSLSAVHS